MGRAMTTHTASEHSFVTSVLRRHIGFGRRFSVREIAQSFRWCARTVKAWVSGDTEPSPRKLFALEQLLGEQFVRDLLAEIGYAGAFKVGAAKKCPHEHAALMAKALTALLDALADERSPGRVDHLESPRIIQLYGEVSSESGRLVHELQKKAAA